MSMTTATFGDKLPLANGGVENFIDYNQEGQLSFLQANGTRPNHGKEIELLYLPTLLASPT